MNWPCFLTLTVLALFPLLAQTDPAKKSSGFTDDPFLVLARDTREGKIQVLVTGFKESSTRFTATYASRDDDNDQCVIHCSLFFQDWPTVKSECAKRFPNDQLERVLATDLPQQWKTKLLVQSEDSTDILMEMPRNQVTEDDYFIWDDDQLVFSFVLNDVTIRQQLGKPLRTLFDEIRQGNSNLVFQVPFPFAEKGFAPPNKYTYMTDEMTQDGTLDVISIDEWNKRFAKAVRWEKPFSSPTAETTATQSAASQELEKLMHSLLITPVENDGKVSSQVNLSKLKANSISLSGTIASPFQLVIPWSDFDLGQNGTFIVK